MGEERWECDVQATQSLCPQGHTLRPVCTAGPHRRDVAAERGEMGGGLRAAWGQKCVDTRGFMVIEPRAFRVLGECSNQLSATSHAV